MRSRVVRTLYWVPAISLMTLIAYLSHQSQWPDPLVGQPDWLLHGSAYAAVALAVHFGATEGRLRFVSWRPVVISMLVASAYGASDEWHQSFIPGRHAALLDWLADTLGAAIAGLGLWLTSVLPPAVRNR